MAKVEQALERLHNYGRVSRNAHILLVMQPPQPREHMEAVEQARAKTAQEAAFLNEVLAGVESPNFTAYTETDRRYIDHLAAETLERGRWDRTGSFVYTLPFIRLVDLSEQTEAASFAYFATSLMPSLQAPFYEVPSFRSSVRTPHNLAEFKDMVVIIKDVTNQASEEEGFHKVAGSNNWRTALVFWDASRHFAGSLTGEMAA